MNQRPRHLHVEVKENILKNSNSEGVGAITNETFSLLIAISWSVARDYAWIYCQRCWLILENIAVMFYEKIDMSLCCVISSFLVTRGLHINKRPKPF